MAFVVAALAILVITLTYLLVASRAREKKLKEEIEAAKAESFRSWWGNTCYQSAWQVATHGVCGEHKFQQIKAEMRNYSTPEIPSYKR